MLTLGKFDDAIEVVTRKTDEPHIDNLCTQLGEVLAHLRGGYGQIINELIAMYESAAEHNVDVSRQALLDLAQRMAERSER